jgi:MraZ protein
MFVGKSIHTLGKDGRISIPSKMRDIFINKFGSDELYMVLMPNPRDVLCLFPATEFEKIAGKLDEASAESLDDMIENMQQAADICSAAENCKIDGSGRILIPAEMKEAAQIDQEVLVIGARNHIQLWNPELWNYDRKLRGVGSVTPTDKTKKLKAKSSAA